MLFSGLTFFVGLDEIAYQSSVQPERDGQIWSVHCFATFTEHCVVAIGKADNSLVMITAHSCLSSLRVG